MLSAVFLEDSLIKKKKKKGKINIEKHL